MGEARRRGTREDRIRQSAERAWLRDRTGIGVRTEPARAPLPVLAPVRREFVKVERDDGNGHDVMVRTHRGAPRIVRDERGRRYWFDGFVLRRVDSNLSDDDVVTAMRVLQGKKGAA
jgi:hypothetical protein